MKGKVLIKMAGVTKRFPGVVANDNVDFDLHAGEIHSVLGENGAGKTTLMNILSGMQPPDAGNIFVRDRTVRIRSPRDSLRLGIGMVYQHFTLIPNLTVIENLMLGFEGGLLLNLKKAGQRLRQISETHGLSIDPLRKIQDLSVSERQRTEILKILYHGSDVLILDEPTSMLSTAEAEGLFLVLKSLRDDGKAVVLITHHLNEALAVSDRITVMRSGKNVAELDRNTLLALGEKNASDMILARMFGAIPRTGAVGIAKVPEDEPVLELKAVEALNNRGQIGLKRVSFSIRKGEIMGIAGFDNEAQRLLAQVIGGQRAVASGKVFYRGQDITDLSIARRFDLGIRYISDDRINEGCVLTMKLSENAILQSYYRQPFSRYGILNDMRGRSFTRDLIERFAIRAAGPEARIGTLSGGNIQKFILARGISLSPGLIVCSHPTFGLDARTVRDIRELLKEESRQGVAVLLITSDMEELFSCADRLGVLFNGEILDVIERCEATPENVERLMLGIRHQRML